MALIAHGPQQLGEAMTEPFQRRSGLVTQSWCTDKRVSR